MEFRWPFPTDGPPSTGILKMWPNGIDESLATLGINFVNRADIGMVQGRGGFRFALEAVVWPAGLSRRLSAETLGPQSDRV